MALGPADPATGRRRCTAWPATPAQCRAYPFTPTTLLSQWDWAAEGSVCPGIDAAGAPEVGGGEAARRALVHALRGADAELLAAGEAAQWVESGAGQLQEAAAAVPDAMLDEFVAELRLGTRREVVFSGEEVAVVETSGDGRVRRSMHFHSSMKVVQSEAASKGRGQGRLHWPLIPIPAGRLRR